MKLIKLNFVEFHKYFLMAFQEQPSIKTKEVIGTIKYPTYEIAVPFSRRKL